ncbi:MAG TPA: VOC family protein [Gemmatimonadaceae bacterium]|jgi:hypothetical protein
MTRRLDHFLYAGRDLEPMCIEFESLTGVKPNLGGRHPGLGTRNALASLGESVYFELLATDREQQLDGTMGGRIQAFQVPRLFAFMLKASDLETVQQTLERNDIESDLFAASRETPEGQTLRWRLLVPRDNRFGEFVPRFIDWLDTTHPASTSAKGCAFESFEMGHPKAKEIGALLHALDSDIHVLRADRPYLHLSIATPRGSLVLTGNP